MDTVTLLLVDDEEEIIELLTDYLSAVGYKVLGATTGQEALTMLNTQPVDGILLDVMLPGASGFAVCQQVRQKSDVPILFLSARQDDVSKLRGLGLGADDYIAKTSSPAEVAARVKAVLRRYRKGSSVQPIQLRFGRMTLDLTAREVLVDGTVTQFTPKEFELLRLLAEHPRQVFTREQIVERLWGGFKDPQSVSGLITRIRTKIEPDPDHPTYIATVWGIGYRFEGVATP